jgi:hypothetical protein
VSVLDGRGCESRWGDCTRKRRGAQVAPSRGDRSRTVGWRAYTELHRCPMRDAKSAPVVLRVPGGSDWHRAPWRDSINPTKRAISLSGVGVLLRNPSRGTLQRGRPKSTPVLSIRSMGLNRRKANGPSQINPLFSCFPVQRPAFYFESPPEGIRSRTVGQSARARAHRLPARAAKSTLAVLRTTSGAQPAQSILARFYQPHKTRDFPIKRRFSTSKSLPKAGVRWYLAKYSVWLGKSFPWRLVAAFGKVAEPSSKAT